MIEKLKPLKDCILVKRRDQEEKTSSGLYMPDSAKDKNQTGIVISTGKGKILSDGNLLPMQIMVGNIVFFGKYAGIETSNDHLILREDEILGIFEE